MSWCARRGTRNTRHVNLNLVTCWISPSVCVACPHAAFGGSISPCSYSGWPPLRCVRTASPTSRTIGSCTRRTSSSRGQHGRLSSDIPKRYTGARDSTFARSARNNWIPKRDGYIHTYIHTYIQTISEIRRKISCLALQLALLAIISSFATFFLLFVIFLVQSTESATAS